MQITIFLQKRQNILILYSERNRALGCIARQHMQALEHLAREPGKWQSRQVLDMDPFPRLASRQKMLLLRGKVKNADVIIRDGNGMADVKEQALGVCVEAF